MSILTVKSPKPRNPLVAAARFRQAGPHGAKAGAERRAGARALRRELTRLDLARELRARPPSV
ncbi:MAG: hypothetical protein ACTHL8_16125 [Burkholderiaceae bacterium]